MPRRIIVINSGATEQMVLPLLLEHLRPQVDPPEVRIPPRRHALTSDIVERLLRAAWWEGVGRGRPPEKIVVLVDADASSVEDAVQPFAALAARNPRIECPILTTAAKWHLEAWFFADSQALRRFLGRDLGSVDASAPDAIENPKVKLRHLLGTPYTARIAEQIGRILSPDSLRRSESFRRFESAALNGTETR